MRQARASSGNKNPDDGLDAITAWCAWFVTAHRQRLSDLHLPVEQFDRELTACTAIGDAVAARMRSDYLARRP